jgi:hypothetical protein
MTDFYTLLKQSIIDRGIRNPRDREEVYAQARRAVIKQLWDFRPPLAADEIDTRVGAYDTAVERIEADLKVTFAASEPSRALTRAAPAPRQAAPAREPAMANGNGRASGWENTAEPQRGVPRAAGRQQRTPAPVYEEDACEAEPAYTPPRRNGRGADRWADPQPFSPGHALAAIRSQGVAWLGSGEQLKVRLLMGAIGGLVVLLIAISAYLLTNRNPDGVTLAIGVRREVSDAATASRIAAEKVELTQSFAVFDGHDPTVFVTTPDNPIRFDSVNGFARISSSTGAPGVKVLVGPGLASSLAGKQVRIVITARSSLEVGAAAMRFAYQSGLAISHWQTANLGSDYQEVGMVWRVPTMRTSTTGDYLLIEPGIPGDGTGADVQSIRIDLLAS